MARLLTDEQDSFLRSIAKGRSIQECTDVLNNQFKANFSFNQIKCYKSNHKISSGMRPCDFVDNSKRSLLNKEQDEFLRNNVKGIGNVELTNMINDKFGTHFTVSQIEGYKSCRNISSGLTGYFPKGHIPFNKGKKGCMGANVTSFKPGDKPKNIDSIGTEKMLADGYVWVKIDNQSKVPKGVNWKQKHRIIWEREHGPIPEGYMIIFLDGDHENFDIDNLDIITKAENLIMNRKGLFKSDKDVTKSGVQLAKLVNKINKKKR